METYKERVFKYIDIEGAKKSLKNKTLLFQKPSVLNDPFDCSSELIELKDPKKYISHLIERFHSDWSIAERRRKKTVMLANFKKNGLSEVLDMERDRVSLSSFSKRNDISLMWSYYCKSHFGITIGYEIPGGLFPFDRHPAFLFEVDYMKEIQRIEMKPEKEEFVFKWLTAKSFEWEHEKEVRLVHMHDFSEDEKQYKKCDPSIVKKITFGVNTFQEDVEEIFEILKSDYDFDNIELTEMIIGNELFTIKEVPFEP